MIDRIVCQWYQVVWWWMPCRWWPHWWFFLFSAFRISNILVGGWSPPGLRAFVPRRFIHDVITHRNPEAGVVARSGCTAKCTVDCFAAIRQPFQRIVERAPNACVSHSYYRVVSSHGVQFSLVPKTKATPPTRKQKMSHAATSDGEGWWRFSSNRSTPTRPQNCCCKSVDEQYRSIGLHTYIQTNK